MSFDYDHDRFVSKNRGLARAYDVDRRDRSVSDKGFSRQERQSDASCFNCKHKGKCVEFRQMRTGGTAGAASFGGNEKFICDRYLPVPSDRKTMSDRQIRSLLKNTRMGR